MGGGQALSACVGHNTVRGDYMCEVMQSIELPCYEGHVDRCRLSALLRIDIAAVTAAAAAAGTTVATVL